MSIRSHSFRGLNVGLIFPSHLPYRVISHLSPSLPQTLTLLSPSLHQCRLRHQHPNPILRALPPISASLPSPPPPSPSPFPRPIRPPSGDAAWSASSLFLCQHHPHPPSSSIFALPLPLDSIVAPPHRRRTVMGCLAAAPPLLWCPNISAPSKHPLPPGGFVCSVRSKIKEAYHLRIGTTNRVHLWVLFYSIDFEVCFLFLFLK